MSAASRSRRARPVCLYGTLDEWPLAARLVDVLGIRPDPVRRCHYIYGAERKRNAAALDRVPETPRPAMSKNIELAFDVTSFIADTVHDGYFEKLHGVTAGARAITFGFHQNLSFVAAKNLLHLGFDMVRFTDELGRARREHRAPRSMDEVGLDGFAALCLEKKARTRAQKLALASKSPMVSAAVWFAEELHARPRPFLIEARDALPATGLVRVLSCFLDLSEISTITAPFLDVAENTDVIPLPVLKKLARGSAPGAADLRAIVASRRPAPRAARAAASGSSRRRR